MIVTICTLDATEETGLARDIDRASGLALATEVAGADLVRSVRSRAGIEPG